MESKIKDNETFSIDYTYDALVKNFQTVESRQIYSFSEFIDNSIASYSSKIKKISQDSEDIDVKGLKIDFNIDENKCLIKIVDNAGGMTYEELKNALQPGYVFGKSDNNLNQYGVGMKYGIFQLGNKFEIYTKPINHVIQGQYYVNFNYDEKNKSEPVKFHIDTINDNICNNELTSLTSGTIIVIKETLNTRHFSNVKKLKKELIDGLGWRYHQLIKEQNLEINFKYVDSIGKEEENIKVEGFIPKNFYSIKNTVDNIKSENSNIDISTDKFYEHFINTCKKNGVDVENNSITNWIDLLKNPNKELYFNDVINIPEINKNIKINWGILGYKCKNNNSNHSYFEMCGITLIHKHRCIKHGFNLGDDNGIEKFANFCSNNGQNNGGNNTIRRMFGWIDLTGIESPERNKKDFKWGSINGGYKTSDDIEKFWKSKYSDIKEILNALKDTEKYFEDQGKKESSNSLKKRNDSFIKSLPTITHSKTHYDENNTQIDNISLKIFDVEFHFEIIYQNEWNDDNFYPFTIKHLYKEKTIQILVNKQNEYCCYFLKNSDSERNRKDLCFTFLPTCIIVSFLQFYIDAENNEDLRDLKDINHEIYEDYKTLIDNLKTIDPKTIFASILKKLKKVKDEEHV